VSNTQFDISAIKELHDIVQVIKNSGVELKKRGSRYVGNCPFHRDEVPSFVVYENRFYCFGCHERGDVLDFLMKLHGCDFKTALAHLGIDNLQNVPVVTGQEYEKRKIKRELVRKFRQWEVDYSTELGLMIRVGHKALKTLSFDDDLRKWLSDQIPVWEYRLEILATRNDRLKFELWRSVNGSAEV